MGSIHLCFPIGLSKAEETSHQILHLILHIRIEASSGFMVARRGRE
ncbi:MAG: hypothetical protein OJF51_002177 [Nitrospira sp.]|nr:MAG: hypothetical protein OJF51_002177 [Nitrospira sp.]